MKNNFENNEKLKNHSIFDFYPMKWCAPKVNIYMQFFFYVPESNSFSKFNIREILFHASWYVECFPGLVMVDNTLNIIFRWYTSNLII